MQQQEQEQAQQQPQQQPQHPLATAAARAVASLVLPLCRAALAAVCWLCGVGKLRFVLLMAAQLAGPVVHSLVPGGLHDPRAMALCVLCAVLAAAFTPDDASFRGCAFTTLFFQAFTGGLVQPRFRSQT